MPVILPSHLLFSENKQPLNPKLTDDLVAIARKIQSPQGPKSVFETFKKHFAKVSGEPCYLSSDAGWAETDLVTHANDAAVNDAGFLVAFCNACEEIGNIGGSVPGIELINTKISEYGCHYQISNGKLVETTTPVESPKFVEPTPQANVIRALADASALLGRSGASSGVDRIHTALHGYLIFICNSTGIEVPEDPTTTKLFKLLRNNHPQLQPHGPRAKDVTKVLNSLASVLDALSPIRNQASLAHPNELLDEPEALAAINATRTLFRYIQDSLSRGEFGNST